MEKCFDLQINVVNVNIAGSNVVQDLNSWKLHVITSSKCIWIYDKTMCMAVACFAIWGMFSCQIQIWKLKGQLEGFSGKFEFGK